MEDSRSGQEKLAAAFASIAFFVPFLMNIRTPFVVKYMKQGFLINIVEFVLALVSSLLWGMMGIASFLNFICVLVSLWLAFQAFSGKEYVIQIILEQADKLIQVFGIGKWFSTK
ncbi:MAG: hypothetical protein HHAS10_04650 [Candidatus Altimarinota bacterium]